MKKAKLDLLVVLPPEAGEADPCVERLVNALRQEPGVLEAHVDRTSAEVPKLCLHYDPTALRGEQIQALVEDAGAKLKARFEHLSVPLGGLRHERQSRLVEGVFAKQPGVLHVAVSFGSRRLYVEFDPDRTTRAALLAVAAHAGVATWEEPATPAQAAREQDEHEHEHGGPFGERVGSPGTELEFAL